MAPMPERPRAASRVHNAGLFSEMQLAVVPERAQIDAVIAVLEQHRSSLGDAVVDHAIATLRRSQAQAAAPGVKLRQVSILFCDIVDSTAMLQGLRPEDALEVLDVPLQRFATLVAEAGGKVLRLTGDGLKAAFGAEQAREDDAQHAVAAGLALLREAAAQAVRLKTQHGISCFQVRVGINTGDVVLGGGIENDRTAMGHAVHIAARLEQRAAPGQLCIAHSTWSLVRDRFDMREQPPLFVKGHDGPLRTHLVLAQASEGGSATRTDAPRLEVPMIGRDEELAELRQLLRQVLATTQRRAVVVLADAGTGKSRLLRELELAVTNGPWTTLHARAPAAALAQPYGLLHDLVTRWLGIAADEPAHGARARLVETLSRLLGAPGATAAHLVGRLIGLDFPDDPQLSDLQGSALRQLAFRALRQALQAASAAAPLLLVMEDLHWADDGSLAFLQEFADGTDPAAVLVVAAARPTLRERHPTWWSAHRELRLQPLAAPQSGLLTDALLEYMPDDGARLVKATVARGGGNPYFMQELVRKLIDDGAVDTSVSPWRAHEARLRDKLPPQTLVAVLQARLDALPDAERAALQEASVFGSSFWDSALTPEAAALLPALERRDLVHARASSVFEGTTEYGFQHDLLRDVTYDTVLKPMRRRVHAGIARWLSQRIGDRGGEFVTTMALHYESAGDAERALEGFERASLEAQQRFANAESLAAIERALALPSLVDPRRRYRLLENRWIVSQRAADAPACDAAMLELCAIAEALDDDGLRAEHLSLQALRADADGDAPRAASLAEQAAACAERALAGGYDREVAIAAVLSHGELAWLATMKGEHSTVDRHLDAGMRWAHRLAGESRGGLLYPLQLTVIKLESLLGQQRVDEAARMLEGMADTMEKSHSIEALALLERRFMLSLQLGRLGDAQDACAKLRRKADELDVLLWQCAALLDQAQIAEARGHALEQRRLARELERLARPAGRVLHVAGALVHEAAALMALGDPRAARERFMQALDSYRAQGRVAEVQDTQSRLAELDWAGDHRAGAMALVDAVLASDQDSEASPEVLTRCARILDAAADARAPTLIARLRARLEQLLGQLPDDAGRQRLVEALPHWRWVEQAPREGT